MIIYFNSKKKKTKLLKYKYYYIKEQTDDRNKVKEREIYI